MTRRSPLEQCAAVLEVLSESRRPMFPIDVREAARIEHPTFQRCIKALEEKGLIQGVPIRNYKMYLITEEGKGVVRRYRRLARELSVQ